MPRARGRRYENRQRTKPRETVRTAVPRSAYQRTPEAGFLYNLSLNIYKRSVYSDLPSFLSQSAICCMAAHQRSHRGMTEFSTADPLATVRSRGFSTRWLVPFHGTDTPGACLGLFELYPGTSDHAAHRCVRWSFHIAVLKTCGSSRRDRSPPGATIRNIPDIAPSATRRRLPSSPHQAPAHRAKVRDGGREIRHA